MRLGVRRPVVPAPRVAQDDSTVEQDDMLSSRWLFGGIAVTSLGLVGAWKTVKENIVFALIASGRLPRPQAEERAMLALLSISVLPVRHGFKWRRHPAPGTGEPHATERHR